MSGDAVDLDTQRWAFDMMLTIDRPIRRGRVAIVPGVAIGQTAVNVQRQEDSELDEEDVSGLIFRIGVAGRIDLSDAWSIGIDLGLTWSPFVRTSLGGTDDLELPLAGAPRIQGGLGIGIVYGGL
jgi:hypothetical protein